MAALLRACFPPFFKKRPQKNNFKKISHTGSLSTPYGNFHLSEDGSIIIDENEIIASSRTSAARKISSYLRTSLEKSREEDLSINDNYTMHTNNPYIDAIYSQRRAGITLYRVARLKSKSIHYTVAETSNETYSSSSSKFDRVLSI